jgi:hypothetical protein
MSENSNQAGEGKTSGKGKKPEVNPKFRGTMEPEVKIVDTPEKKKAAKPRVTKTGSNFILLKELEPSTKMPQQCKQIIGLLSAAENKTMTKEALLAAMVPIITTRQPIERILAFYQSRLVSGNWVRIEPIAAAQPAQEPAPETEPAGEAQAE